MEDNDDRANHIFILDGVPYYSIFDDSDRSYHADSLTGQTPADERREAYRSESTRTDTPRYKRMGK